MNEHAVTSLTISQTVAKEIAEISTSDKIINSVVKELVSVEIDRRSTALVKTVTAASSLRKDIYKVKPDIVGYSEDGSVASSSYSKQKLEEKKKLTDKLAKLDKAISNAVEKGDYSDILSLNES